jgi:hypothetical protein
LLDEDDGAIIARVILDGKALAVSDGSYKDMHGTSAFILSGCTDQGRITGTNAILGDHQDQLAYRSELGGISGIITTVLAICKIHGITSGSIEVDLDGNQALKAVFFDWPLNPRQADFDLVQDICNKIQRSPLQWTGIWIEGHKDDHKSKTLDRQALLNIECDSLAKSYWNSRSLAQNWPDNQEFGDEQWTLWIKGQKLSRINKKWLYAHTLSAGQKLIGKRSMPSSPNSLRGLTGTHVK